MQASRAQATPQWPSLGGVPPLPHGLCLIFRRCIAPLHVYFHNRDQAFQRQLAAALPTDINARDWLVASYSTLPALPWRQLRPNMFVYFSPIPESAPTCRIWRATGPCCTVHCIVGIFPPRTYLNSLPCHSPSSDCSTTFFAL